MIPVKYYRNDAFSYQCNCCNRCCRHKDIQVNPFELLQIAKALGLTTTQILNQFVQIDKPFLKQKSDGSCAFLSMQGCTIHSHRPGVCRIYPLGRLKDEDGTEYFIHLTPAINSAGIYGNHGTIYDYIVLQGADPYFEAGLKLLTLQRRIIEALNTGFIVDMPDNFGEKLLDWLDVDKILLLTGNATYNQNITEKLNRYLEILDQWLSGV